jgi:hypothetical protein
VSRFWFTPRNQTTTPMAKVHSREIPYLAPRPFQDGSGWYVEAQWINRPKEKIGDFATFAEARDWITLESTSYFVVREIDLMIKHPEQSPS